MKRNLLIATLLCGLTASSFAQGVVALGAAARVKYTTDGTTLANVPAGSSNNIATYGGINIAIYSASSGTVLQSNGTSAFLGAIPALTTNLGWYLMTSAPITTISPTAGSITSTALTLNTSAGAANAVEQLEIVAWTGNFSSFAAAMAAGTGLVGWGGSLLIPGGGAFGFQFTTGDGVTSTPVVTTGAAAWNGLVLAPVPEPCTMVLGGLGAAALLLFRRRK